VITGGIPSPSEVARSASLPPNWVVEFHDDPAGSTNIILLPDPIDDAVGPTLVIYWDGPVVRLDALRWDIYSGIGEYGSLDGALAVAAKLIREATAAESVH
jgi:hypothetical protein